MITATATRPAQVDCHCCGSALAAVRYGEPGTGEIQLVNGLTIAWRKTSAGTYFGELLTEFGSPTGFADESRSLRSVIRYLVASSREV